MATVRAAQQKKKKKAPVVKRTNAEVQALAKKIKEEWDKKSAVIGPVLEKAPVIRQILSIYREHQYERLCERPLESYTLYELEHHLSNLHMGRFPWRV